MQITRSNLSFVYDAGNRIIKIEKPYNYLTNTAHWKYTYYSRDASGNVMGTYMVSPGSAATEYPIYGSSRVGLYQRSGITSTAGAAAVGLRYPALRDYELANHLGNVYVTLTGIKIGTDTTADGKADVYKASVVSANDYYAFGMALPGRSYNNIGYRYGFNGKEKDSEWNSGGAEYDYGFRIYDPRIAKFLSVDPLTESYPELTPYQFASNTPIESIDLDGLERISYNLTRNAEGGTQLTLESRGPETETSFFGLVENTVPLHYIVNYKGQHYEFSGNDEQVNSGSFGIRYNNKKFIEFIRNPNPDNFESHEETYGNFKKQVFLASAIGVIRNATGGENRFIPFPNGKGIIYKMDGKDDKFGNSGKPYYGQVESEARYKARQEEHIRANPNARLKFKIVDRGDPGKDLGTKEQKQITNGGGPTNKSNPNGGTSNRKNVIKQNKR